MPGRRTLIANALVLEVTGSMQSSAGDVQIPFPGALEIAAFWNSDSFFPGFCPILCIGKKSGQTYLPAAPSFCRLRSQRLTTAGQEGELVGLCADFFLHCLPPKRFLPRMSRYLYFMRETPVFGGNDIKFLKIQKVRCPFICIPPAKYAMDMGHKPLNLN